MRASWDYGISGSGSKGYMIDEMNNWLAYYVPEWNDEQGKAIFTSLMSTAYNYVLVNTPYSASYNHTYNS